MLRELSDRGRRVVFWKQLKSNVIDFRLQRKANMFRGSAYSMETDKDLMNNSGMEEEEIRIAMLGAPDTGKSSMLACIDNEPFREDISSTKTLQPRFKKLKINNNCIINLLTWDGPGSKVSAYLHDGSLDSVDGFLCIFELGERGSLHTVMSIHQDLRKIKERECAPLLSILVGNKSDYFHCAEPEDLASLQATDSEADNFSRRENLLYLKTSAKENSYVKDAVVQLVKMVIRVRRKGSQNNRTRNLSNLSNVSQVSEDEQKCGCCRTH